MQAERTRRVFRSSSTRWPNRGRVSICRMRSAWTSAVKRGVFVVSRCHITGYGAEREFLFGFVFEAERPAVVAFFFWKVDTTVVPGVAVAAVARLHGDERCAGGIGRGVLEKRAGRAGLILAAIQERGDGGDAARLTDFPKEGTALTSIIGECSSGGRVGPEWCGSILQQLGVEERQRILERVRFRSGYCAFDSCCVQAVGYEPRNQKVNGIFETASIIAGVLKQKSRFAVLCVFYWLRVVADTQNNLILSL